MPPVLVSANRFGAGLTDDLRRDPVPEIAGPVNDATAAAFPAVIVEDIPLPRERVELKTPNVPIEKVCDTLASAAQSHELPVPFLIRLIWQESRFDPRAISPVGAQGVAQFMPATAAAMGLKNPFDPLEALHFSARLLRELVGQFGNLGLAAAAYNAGPKRILDWMAKGGKLPEETRNYVQTITGHPAERWRVTRPGRLALAVPERAPCQGVSDVAHVVEMPAPVPVPLPKQRARARMLAKGKTGERKEAKAGDRKENAAAAKKPASDVSAARKQSKARAGTKAKPLAVRAKAGAARKNAKKRGTRAGKS